MTGESVAGRFTLVEELGRGGMGVVWRATDTRLGREVAVKQILAPPHLSEAALAERRARMLREGRAAARLNHPNAVTVYDVLDEEDGLYIVMEFVRAVPLWDLVQREGPLPLDRAARIGLQLLEALAAAHAVGIVHRDVKPGNVLVLPGDRVKLADFGIASLEGEARLTGTGALMGSPAYMAPEQARGKPCTSASDLWSLGATLYYTLEGRDAFEAPAPAVVIAKILGGVPARPANAGPLEPLLASLLHKDPVARPEARTVQDALVASARTTAVPLPSAEPGIRPDPTVVSTLSQPSPTPQGAAAHVPIQTGPQPFRAPVKRRLLIGRTLGRLTWTIFSVAVMCLIVTVAGNSVDRDAPGFLVAVVLLIGLGRVVQVIAGSAVVALRAGFFEAGPRGIAFSRGGYSAGYGWEQVAAVSVVSRGWFRRRAVMVRVLAGTTASLTPLLPQRLSGDPSESPWLDHETGWIGLCHLDEVKADAADVEQAVRGFAGPRWQASR